MVVFADAVAAPVVSGHYAMYVYMMGALFTAQSAAMVAPLASSGLARCEAVLHGYGTSLLEGRGFTDL